MTSISSAGSPLTTGLTQTPPEGSAAALQGTGAAAALAPMSAELQAQLNQTLGATGQKGDGVKNALGAPNLAAPISLLSADDLVALLQDMQSKSQDQQLQTAKGSLEKSRIDAQKNNEAQQKKIQEWIEKCEKESKAGLVGKIFSWIGKIAAVIAAAIAVVASVAASPFTGGASLALTALAVVGLVAATMSLADQISQATGGPEISLSNMVTKMVGGLLEAMGVPKEKAEQIARVTAGALAVVMPVALLVEPKLLGTMVQGIAELSGADPKTTMALTMAFTMVATLTVGIGMAVAGFQVGKLATDVANTAIKTVANIANAGAQVASGTAQIGQGAATIAKGVYAEQGEKALAGKKELEAFLAKINQGMEDQREELRKIMQQIEEGVQAVSQMMQSSADSMSQITSNLGKRAAV